MRTLRLGMTGSDVYAWEYFLLGQNPNSTIIVDGVFDDKTLAETKNFQKNVGFTGKDIDGIVGPKTLGKAMLLGFNPLDDDSNSEFGPNWPVIKPGVKQLTSSERAKIFGTFSYVAAPTATNPEGIKITDDWAKKNIVSVHVPQLKNVKGAPKSCIIQFHKLASKQLQLLFAAWERHNLMGNVLTWSGSWVPRFVRGSRTTLSNHSYGTAFDINAQWNKLGSQPALKGTEGSVRELVEIANDHGFFWGGHYSGRPDGMHFECYKIL